jgi:Prophage tail length tape measure protein
MSSHRNEGKHDVTDLATLGLRIDSAPVVKGAADLDKLAAASARAELAALSLAKAQASGSPEKLARATLEAARANEALAKAQNSVAQTAKTGGAALQRMGTEAVAAGRSAGAANAQMMNLVHQMQDIGVMLQMGASPFTIMMQQGTQIAAAFGPGVGVGGALRGMGVAIAGMVNPVSLVTMGLVGAAAAAATFFQSGQSQADAFSAALKEQDDIVSRLKDRFGDLAKAIDQLPKESIKIIGADIEVNRKDITDALASQIGAIESQLEGFAARNYNRSTQRGPSEEFRDIRDAVAALQESLASGRPDVTAFREEMIRVQKSAEDDAVAKLAEQFFSLTKESGSAERALSQLQNAQQLLNNEAQRGVDIYRQFQAVRSIAYEDAAAKAALQIEMDREGARARTMSQGSRKNTADILAGGVIPEFATGLQAEKRERERAAKDAAREAERQQKDAERKAEQRRREMEREAEASLREQTRHRDMIQDILNEQEGSIRLQRAEIDLVGKTAEERAVILGRIETENELKQRGIDLTSLEGQALLKNAEVLARLSSEYETMQAQSGQMEQLFGGSIDSIVDWLAEGELSWESFGKMALGVLKDIAREMLILAIANPLKNALFGSNLPTFGSMFGGAQNGNMASAGIAQAQATALRGMAQAKDIASDVGNSVVGGLKAIITPGGGVASQIKGSTWFKAINQGSTRNLSIVPELKSEVLRAVEAVYGPGSGVKLFSGGQPRIGTSSRRTGSTRHDMGYAGDFYVYGPDGKQVRGDALAPLGQYWTANKKGGVGLAMPNDGVHLDIHKNRAPFWTYSGATKAQREAMQRGASGMMPDLSSPDGMQKMSRSVGDMGMAAEGAESALSGLGETVPGVGDSLNGLTKQMDTAGSSIFNSASISSDTIVGAGSNLANSATSFMDDATNSFGTILSGFGNMAGSMGGGGMAGAPGGGDLIGGIFSSLLGGLFGGFRAEGGPVEAGKAYVVGERSAELFVPSSSGRIVPDVDVIPRHARGGGPAGASINYAPVIDARGASVEAVDRLEKALRKQAAEIPGVVAKVMKERERRDTRQK